MPGMHYPDLHTQPIDNIVPDTADVAYARLHVLIDLLQGPVVKKPSANGEAVLPRGAAAGQE